jgi:hypothetical protein
VPSPGQFFNGLLVPPGRSKTGNGRPAPWQTPNANLNIDVPKSRTDTFTAEIQEG